MSTSSEGTPEAQIKRYIEGDCLRRGQAYAHTLTYLAVADEVFTKWGHHPVALLYLLRAARDGLRMALEAASPEYALWDPIFGPPGQVRVGERDVLPMLTRVTRMRMSPLYRVHVPEQACWAFYRVVASR